MMASTRDLSHNGRMSTLASIADRYLRLTRLNKPIGILLVGWPMLWALWLAADGLPSAWILTVFVIGAILMRSAGCVVNDFADRRIDGGVKRTRERPIATGEVTPGEALVLCGVLCVLAFALVLTLNAVTIVMSLVAVGLAMLYPFTKRLTFWPQAFLGLAFGWAVPMAYTAVIGTVPLSGWILFAATLVWALIYDSFYAIVDRDDDIKLGVKSTAVLWGRFELAFIALFQVIFFGLLVAVGVVVALGAAYYVGLAVAAAMAVYHQWLTRHRDRMACFRAFMQHNVMGGIIFAGIVIAQLLG
ncbi:4-hydroxybenzoate octaprenyltransferase [Salinisphaera sp. USBA-960]|uniref:4-hydroxybenzoate octaprenyltransferase n=1 Tax=Salinisphaera orenii TaxID=856731 RepID=UPI001473EA15|nr:4-hydroxybenzoate octaprenyltransferase [Salifodinibacter halophilus]NNC25528.1 4-hydroxybenzoate octaprenyltransferase [Salifodinibacter halophilus]